MKCGEIGGTIVLFDRKMLRNFRKDGHNWKKKKDGKTVKEAHEHLKVWLSHVLVYFRCLLYVPVTLFSRKKILCYMYEV